MTAERALTEEAGARSRAPVLQAATTTGSSPKEPKARHRSAPPLPWQAPPCPSRTVAPKSRPSALRHSRGRVVLGLPWEGYCSRLLSRMSGPLHPDLAARDSSAGQELLVVSGDDTSVLVADLLQGNSSPDQLLDLGDRLFFVDSDGVHDRQAWTTDGTAAGAVGLTGNGDTPAVRDATNATLAGGFVFFFAVGDDFVTRLHAIEGQPGGTVEIAGALPSGEPLHAVAMAPVGSGARVQFAAHQVATGVEPWTASADLALLADIAAGPAHSFPQPPIYFATTLLFGAYDPVHGLEPRIVPVAIKSSVAVPGQVDRPLCGRKAKSNAK